MPPIRMCQRQTCSGNGYGEKLTVQPVTNVDRVLHCEMSICAAKASRRTGGEEDFLPRYERNGSKRAYVFKGTSDSGRRLLKSLYEYCLSYEQQKWARFVHGLKASDFNGPASGIYLTRKIFRNQGKLTAVDRFSVRRGL